ncbi:MAG: glycosyltransferase family 2 protein [Flavobacteriaceae bacterium]|nr:glycosyltransferase family 2 protein [Flavobacteriaceae bacterium]
MPSIAVVIPVYNGALTIAKSIKSLENQTFKDWVAIIVNDGSTDNTKEIIEALDNKKHIKIHLEKNRGRGFARQTALNKIRELKIPYMCMLDADDWYFNDKLEYQFTFMEKNKDTTLLSNSILVEDDAKISLIKPFDKIQCFTYHNYNNFIQLPHASSIIRVNDIEGINYNVDLKYSEDKDFLRRILLSKKYCFDPKIAYCYNKEFSFSFLKYKKSLLCDNQSFLNLPVSWFSKLKFLSKNYFKILVVKILIVLNKVDVYFSKVNDKISSDELQLYNIQKQLMPHEN